MILKSMWKQYFKFVMLEPGKVVTYQFDEIDFSADTVGIEMNLPAANGRGILIV